jgi:hypothetical protein
MTYEIMQNLLSRTNKNFSNVVALDHDICYQIVRMIITMIDPYYVLETETKCKFYVTFDYENLELTLTEIYYYKNRNELV